MRATTRSMPNVSRATRAMRMFELSPLVTAATATACSMPASTQAVAVEADPGDRSVPVKPVPSRAKASGRLSMTATVWPPAGQAAGERGAHPAAADDTTCTLTRPPPVWRAHDPTPAPALRCAGAVAERASAPVPESGRPYVLDDEAAPDRATDRLARRSTTSGSPRSSRLPVFASDAISSTAYATEEILLVLVPAGPARRPSTTSSRSPSSSCVLLAIVVTQLPPDDLRLPERRRLLHRVAARTSARRRPSWPARRCSSTTCSPWPCRVAGGVVAITSAFAEPAPLPGRDCASASSSS